MLDAPDAARIARRLRIAVPGTATPYKRKPPRLTLVT